MDVWAISPFNFLRSALYGMDAIATDEHGFSRIIAGAGFEPRMNTNTCSCSCSTTRPRQQPAFSFASSREVFFEPQRPQRSQSQCRWFVIVGPHAKPHSAGEPRTGVRGCSVWLCVLREAANVEGSIVAGCCGVTRGVLSEWYCRSLICYA